MYDDLNTPIGSRPPRLKSGDTAAVLRRQSMVKAEEDALGVKFVCHRQLFGHCYYGIMGEFAYSLSRNGGVFIAPCVETFGLTGERSKPGDIGLLVIPYEDGHLILEHTLAIEIKVIRASFEKQGKSPNQWGTQQAQGLLAAGFPFVAIIHLIVSDDSPDDSLTEFGTARIIGTNGAAQLGPTVRSDPQPVGLIDRAYGRLEKAATPMPELGLAAAFLGTYKELLAGPPEGLWIPSWKEATKNRHVSKRLLHEIRNHFHRHYKMYMDTPAR